MRIVIGADHNGVAMKAQLIRWLTAEGHEVDDRGAHDTEVVDYPPLCADIGRQVVEARAERGIVIGGTGGGEAIACNKIRGIRAGLCHSVFLAEISSAHNKTNVLVLGAKVVGPEEAAEITSTWLATPFKGDRHQHRLDQIAALERGESLG
ncbi:RpiB/LacA/LacB family sugar-phosphate isomerase [Micromonospora sp. 4G57]|uniref:RpiB/LacA/LacB family sugar-phosphate isomerase n=1 Tax=Micromonospora sicca TaxID=2202420 RepID=A0ABU5JE67_9ACTN|nr:MULTISPECIES: RpiB/LacA/LacB family sugar-phosphate isomerase [unclassified Micromonospora]MDZ5445029.1 RpiB/LacA/LacB family sugar-phosphate isomerase [Micromonospora sp. 4G57]MDZ5490851.1 RpiB/LacA/LacB family sugar-phosphate isomerase [Micromonospora sp. 4G53]